MGGGISSRDLLFIALFFIGFFALISVISNFVPDTDGLTGWNAKDIASNSSVPAQKCSLDVDMDGKVLPSTDMVYLFRYHLGLSEIVPSDFRTFDSSIPSDQMIKENVESINVSSLDVDMDGKVLPSTDMVYLFRYHLGLSEIVPSDFRTFDSSIPSDQMIKDTIERSGKAGVPWSEGDCGSEIFEESESGICTDSDVNSVFPDGKNYYQRGEVYDSESGTPLVDSCTGDAPGGRGDRILEYWCDGSTLMVDASFVCPHGCEDGACVGEETPAEETLAYDGNTVNVLKVFGQGSTGDTSNLPVTANRIYHASGVVVDTSSSPNKVYVVDTGNNRILGFDSLGVCSEDSLKQCTNDPDCSGTCIIDSEKEADLIFGQTTSSGAACNGDNNFGLYGSPSSGSLCLIGYPDTTNIEEYWMRTNIDVDGEGNLYVPDVYNNRVLKYNEPFSSNISGGRGDSIADYVWGQDDMGLNGINKGMGENLRNSESLFISFNRQLGSDHHVTTRGVSVDGNGNVWVADTFNKRVLRFPVDSQVADLVIGQDDFTSRGVSSCDTPGGKSLSRFCRPTLAKVHPRSNELYVIDEYQGFNSRILVFDLEDASNGMSASRVLIPEIEGEIENDAWDYVFQATGLAFNPVEGFGGPEGKGVIWVNEHRANRVSLLDGEGNILRTIGSADENTKGCNENLYSICGQHRSSTLCWPGGSIGIDSANNIYLADEKNMRVSRFSLPYNTFEINSFGTEVTCLPEPNGHIVDGLQDSVSALGFKPGVGFNIYGDQLIVGDDTRLMVWEDYLSYQTGDAADFVLGHSFLGTRSLGTIDDKDRLWLINDDGKIMVYELPLNSNSRPIVSNGKLRWPDGSSIDYNSFEHGIAFDSFSKKLWVVDWENNRLLRVSDYDAVETFPYVMTVDAVIGQPSKESTCCNQAPKIGGVCQSCRISSECSNARPKADSLCQPHIVEFDTFGNMYVSESTYEGHGNLRVVVFLEEDLSSIGSLFPNLQAKKVFGPNNFNSMGTAAYENPRYFSATGIAFNSRNEMVVGVDGYRNDGPGTRHLRQLLFYSNPLEQSGGNFIQGQDPDAYIEIPLGASGRIEFDEQDNLLVRDHTWQKIWMVNLDRDPFWLRYV